MSGAVHVRGSTINAGGWNVMMQLYAAEFLQILSRDEDRFLENLSKKGADVSIIDEARRAFRLLRNDLIEASMKRGLCG